MQREFWSSLAISRMTVRFARRRVDPPFYVMPDGSFRLQDLVNWFRDIQHVPESQTKQAISDYLWKDDGTLRYEVFVPEDSGGQVWIRVRESRRRPPASSEPAASLVVREPLPPPSCHIRNPLPDLDPSDAHLESAASTPLPRCVYTGQMDTDSDGFLPGWDSQVDNDQGDNSPGDQFTIDGMRN